MAELVVVVTGGVARAMSAIRDGYCEVAAVISADAPSTRWGANYGAFRREFQDPVGVQGPPAMFGLLMNRYEHQYKLNYDALAKIATVQREHALMNDNALPKFKTPMTKDDYYKSRVVADPLRVLDLVMFCDGGNGFLVMKQERAQQLGIKKTVRPAAYAELTNVNGNKATPDITETGFSHIAPKVFGKAGLKPQDISMFQPYDDFTIAVLMQFEDFGFCKRGDGQRLRDVERHLLQRQYSAQHRRRPDLGRSAGSRKRWPQPGGSRAPVVRRGRQASGQEPEERTRYRYRRDPLRPQLGNERCDDCGGLRNDR